QTDYAFANRYLGAFADWRQSMQRVGLRRGHTCAIHWPPWSNGGLPVNEETAQRLWRVAGITGMSDEAGFAALQAALACGAAEQVVTHGRAPTMLDFLAGFGMLASAGHEDHDTIASPSGPAAETAADALAGAAEQYLISLLSGLLKL